MNESKSGANSSSASPLLRMTGIVKSFDGQRVLHGVDFDVRRGEVHILAGENGAGKSTLIKILGGVHKPDSGSMELSGEPLRPRSPRDAARRGVAIIHQELSLVPSMSVMDNVFLGREQSRLGWLRRGSQRAECDRILGRLGLRLDVGQPIESLPISLQQMIEIAKALAEDAEIIVMDEPTSALNEPEVDRLFECIDMLKSRGRGIVYITHKLEEVYQIADRITVLRDGRFIASDTAKSMPAEALIKHMVGREIDPSQENVSSPVPPDAKSMLTIKNLTVRAARSGRGPRVDNVSLQVKAGEILGLAGLQGSGNSDLLLGLFGAYGRETTGHVLIDGQPYRPLTPRRAISKGLALVTNDRQGTGLVLGMSVSANATLASVPQMSPCGWMLSSRERRMAGETTQALRLRAASLAQNVSTLSGGNQQKVVLAKWINTKPRIIMLDEPTRGVDIGAKQEIYQLMRSWRDAGHALLLITSEMPELLMLADRILVMHRGKGQAMFDRHEATQEKILAAAMGGGSLGE